MPLKIACLLLLLLLVVLPLNAAESGGVYVWSGEECLSDSGDSAYVGKKCSADSDCPAALFCVLPDSSGGFCSFECKADSDCGHASACMKSNLGAESLCIPTGCPDEKDWPDYADCSAKLSADETENTNDTNTRKECKTVCACDQSHGINFGAAFVVLALMGIFFVLRFSFSPRVRANRNSK